MGQELSVLVEKYGRIEVPVVCVVDIWHVAAHPAPQLHSHLGCREDSRARLRAGGADGVGSDMRAATMQPAVPPPTIAVS